MLKESSPTSEVEMLNGGVEKEIKSAVIVAEASTKALSRSILIGTIPIIEFGLIIAFSILIVQIPMRIIRRLE